VTPQAFYPCYYTHLCKIGGCPSSVITDSSFLGCYAVLFDNQFQKFQRITVPSSLQQSIRTCNFKVFPAKNSLMPQTNSLLWCFINVTIGSELTTQLLKNVSMLTSLSNGLPSSITSTFLSNCKNLTVLFDISCGREYHLTTALYWSSSSAEIINT
jgi:hypothetical protein